MHCLIVRPAPSSATTLATGRSLLPATRKKPMEKSTRKRSSERMGVRSSG